jgi:hypothetical protein
VFFNPNESHWEKSVAVPKPFLSRRFCLFLKFVCQSLRKPFRFCQSNNMGMPGYHNKYMRIRGAMAIADEVTHDDERF